MHSPNSKRIHSPIKKIPIGSQHTVEVLEIDFQGQAVCEVDGRKVFVTGDLLPNEQALIEITEYKKKTHFGKLLEQLTTNNQRIEAICELYGDCGGCDFQSLEYLDQLDYKEKFAISAFNRIYGDKPPTDVSNRILGSPSKINYRNKMEYTLFGKGEKQVSATLGLHRKRSRELLGVQECALELPLIREVAEGVVTNLNVSAASYIKDFLIGNQSSFAIRQNSSSEEAILLITTVNIREDAEDVQPRLAEFSKQLIQDNPKLKGVHWNYRKFRESPPAPYIPLYGSETIKDAFQRLDGSWCNFNLGPTSFFQINPSQMTNLYNLAMNSIELSSTDVIVELYAGSATIGCWIAPYVNKIFSVEVDEPALGLANLNISDNKLGNVEFIRASSVKGYKQLIKRGISADVVIVDPPRSGCEGKLISQLVESPVSRIVYISCNPATCARDAKLLIAGGYSLNYWQPVDMFPMTRHVELVSSFVYNKE